MNSELLIDGFGKKSGQIGTEDHLSETNYVSELIARGQISDARYERDRRKILVVCLMLNKWLLQDVLDSYDIKTMSDLW